MILKSIYSNNSLCKRSTYKRKILTVSSKFTFDAQHNIAYVETRKNVFFSLKKNKIKNKFDYAKNTKEIHYFISFIFIALLASVIYERPSFFWATPEATRNAKDSLPPKCFAFGAFKAIILFNDSFL